MYGRQFDLHTLYILGNYLLGNWPSGKLNFWETYVIANFLQEKILRETVFWEFTSVIASKRAAAGGGIK